jgi:hypothetical protein
MKRRDRLERLFIELKWREYQKNPSLFFEQAIQVPAGEILGGAKGRTSFELFDYQKQALETFRNERYVIVLKSRQLGLTTLAMAYAMWMLIFRPGSNIIMVSRSQTAADKALELIDFMWSFLPTWVQERGPKLENDAAKHHSYKFSDGMVSRITSYAATRTVAAGQTATLVLWDEAALAEYQEDALRTLIPTTDAGGSMIVFSTARGGHNTFARLYRSADRGENEFKTLFYPWHVSRFMNPLVEQGEVDYTLYESKKRAMSSEPWLFYAEYPSDPDEAFRQSGRSRFSNLPPTEDFEDFPLRGRIVSSEFSGYKFVEDPDGPLRMQESALNGTPLGHKCVISVDPSSGSGGDYTAMTIGWANSDGIPERVAFWHSNTTEPTEYAYDVMRLGHFFSGDNNRPALVAVEKQGGFGDTVVHVLRGENYPNLYVYRYTGHRKYKTEQTFGFPMTPTRRQLVIDTLAKWLDFENGVVMIGLDRMLRRELGAFVVRNDGRVAADVGMNDDLVMSTAIWVYVVEENMPSATNAATSESFDTIQQFSVSHIWDEAENIWASQDKLDREWARRSRRNVLWR